MTTQTPSSPDVAQTLELQRNASGPLLVATDGSASSDAAFPFAMLLSDKLNAGVEVLSVVEPLPLMPDYPVSATAAYLGQPIATEPVRRRAVEQTESLGEISSDWTVDVEIGNPVGVITREARDRDSRMIVIGLNHHNRLDRMLWGDTMLGLVHRASVPVVAVSPTLKTLPRRVVVAVDFSESSIAAVRAALMAVEEPATIYVAHAKVATELPVSELELWDREYDKALPEAFNQITEELDLPAGIKIETVSLRGSAAKAILQFAESASADLIVAGSHGRGAVGRLVIGSVASNLLRGTPCSIMIVPRAAVKALTGTQKERAPQFEPTPEMAQWSGRLEQFTRRNAARATILEVDHPDIGSQAEVRDYPLLGVDFDRHTGRIEIMLGDAEPGGRHLTHSISGVTSIDILSDEKGRDTVLRLAHGSGQTLLTLA